MAAEPCRTGADSIGGVSLAQYAAVTAALADGFPLTEILAVEGLSASAWSRAMSAWKAKLVSEGLKQGPLFESYKIELGRAEDRLSRRVKPLDEDLIAWTGFLKAWSAHASPAELLATHKLRTNDLARLTRRWSSRLEADPSLKKKAASLAKDTRPIELPPIVTEPATLKPSPAARPAKAAPAPAGARPKAEALRMSLDKFAAMSAELGASPDDNERIYAVYGLADRAAREACERAWRARLAEDPDLHRDWKTLTAHYRRQRDAARRAPQNIDATPQPPPPIVVFPSPIQSISPEPIRLAPAPPPPPAAGAHRPLGKTVDMPAFFEPGASVLPFAAGKARKGPGSRRAPNSTRAPASTRTSNKTGKGPASVKAPASVRAPKSTKSPRSIKQPNTMRSPASESAPSTLPSPDNPLAPALPFAQKQKRAPAVAASPRAPLTLEQHASLCVELTVRPDLTQAILARYHLSPAQRDQIDAHWRARVAADPALREAWNRAFSQYRDWFVSQNPIKR